MVTSNKKTRQDSSSATTGDAVLNYERSKNININISDLKLELIKFKKAIKREFSFPLIIALISIWSPIFISDFKSLYGLSGDEIFLLYLMLVVVISFFILFSIFVSFIKLIARIFAKFERIDNWLYEQESCPEKKAELMKKKCKENPEDQFKNSGLSLMDLFSFSEGENNKSK